ncbi:MAG: hypothetical protein WD080_07925 [Egibacteraceae bacterium]
MEQTPAEQMTAADPARAGIERLRAHHRAPWTGRGPQLARLDAFLDDPAAQHALVHQETGRGTTALLVRWVDSVLARDDWAVVFVPISRRFRTAEAGVILGSLGVQLAACWDEDAQQLVLRPHRARARLGGWLLRDTTPAGKRLLVVVDGLDEAVGLPVGADLLPSRLGAGTRVGCRSGPAG